MALLNQSTQVQGQLPKFFETLRAGTAPPVFTRQFLKDIGFTSSNHYAFIGLLKGLGFLTSDGTPTERYKQFLDGSRWRQVLGQAVRDAYSDIFVLKAKPTPSDLKTVAGKYKSTYNISDLQAERNARTFLALLPLCDFTAGQGASASTPAPDLESPSIESEPESSHQNLTNGNSSLQQSGKPPVGLHYNIQIHLPASKDVEVYNAIFKSIRDHLID